MIHAREIRQRLTGKVDMQVSFCMEALAEHMGVYEKKLAEMAAMLDQMSDIVMNIATVSEHLKNAQDAMNKIDPDDGGPSVTR